MRNFNISRLGWVGALVCLIFGITMATPATAAPEATAVKSCSVATQVPDLPLLREGDTGSCITHLQEGLWYSQWAVMITGKFDAATKAAVISFQRSRDLQTDGLVGFRTWRQLRGYDSSRGPNWSERAIIIYRGCPVHNSEEFSNFTSIVDTAQSEGIRVGFAFTYACAEDLTETYGSDLMNVYTNGDAVVYARSGSALVYGAGIDDKPLKGKSCAEVKAALKGGIISTYVQPPAGVSRSTFACALERLDNVRPWGYSLDAGSGSAKRITERIIKKARKGDTISIDVTSKAATGEWLVKIRDGLKQRKNPVLLCRSNHARTFRNIPIDVKC